MLPDLIEIIPLDRPAPAEITAPGSKSITNRALILAALARGEVTLRGALWSEDTQVMVSALHQLGFEIEAKRDPREFCNREIHVKGLGGKIPHGGTAEHPLELFVGNAGTAARFLAALVCLGRGVYHLQGVKRMHERPQAALFEALRDLGYRIDAARDHLPARIYGTGPRAGSCKISIDESSQFASALLLGARVGGWKVQLVGEALEDAAYVAMTRQLIDSFPHDGGEFQIEADASSASYFVAADWLAGHRPETAIKVAAFPDSSWQIDAAFPKFFPLPPRISRASDLGDSIMTAIVLAPFSERAVTFTELGRLRVQECERVAALRTELTKCGAKVSERGQTLTVYPSAHSWRGAEIETYNDHRMAMCFAILGLKIPGIKIKNPACVKKTFPNFFQKLAAPAPAGLGARIVDGRTGQALAGEQLFAG
ncbi:MAG TPA: 3-phosphoshikimate 1-carboxyvinyltransferase [Verrucomicrobiae bacterium]|jgi:3-phosphoshikimate 1-carboxyvinyltransferase|nr:3-phosphoshikimate 1-carboxyvinyltransferase [Verrucomicrobiae bacterium]